MKYPFSLEGVSSVEGYPLSLHAPDPLVEEAATKLNDKSLLLDLGSGQAANGIYLALLGHKVQSLEIASSYIENGRRIIQALGKVALSHVFIEKDMRDLNEEKIDQQFDGILAMRSLQEVSKNDAHMVLKRMRSLTREGGLNIIRAYIATEDQQEKMPHRTLFEPDELAQIYRSSNWTIHKYAYDLKPLDLSTGKPMCQSTVELIAEKPLSSDLHKAQLLAQAEPYRISDPDYYSHLVEQANSFE